jgi:hypothetical protein
MVIGAPTDAMAVDGYMPITPAFALYEYIMVILTVMFSDAGPEAANDFHALA